MTPRIEFAEAISSELLFKAAFSKLSVPQAAALKITYGLPLNDQELEAWSMFQGGATFNELGEVLERRAVPYYPRRYAHVVMVVGRRSGKTTSFSSFVLAYEALCGAHQNHVEKGEDVICLQVAQDLVTARRNLRLIQNVLETSKVGMKMMMGGTGKLEVTAENIKLKHGVTLTVSAPSIKIRGAAIAVVSMDEFAFWPREDSANPDHEVETAVRPAMAQFPNRLILQGSTPYGKSGLLWEYYEAGTLGKSVALSRRKGYQNLLVLHAPTAAMQNPKAPLEYLIQERDKNVDGFEREYLAKFSDSVSGFLSSSLLRACIDRGKLERPYVDGNLYVAALDPGFRKDAFAFTICHHSKEFGVVQDVVRQWKPTVGNQINPAVVMDEIAALLAAYKVPVASTDQYQAETLNQLAIDRGFSLEPTDFTARSKAKIYGNLQQLLNQKRLRLLDNLATLDELLKLERTILPTGGVRIAAPGRQHDDMASVLALAAFRAIWMLPTEEKADPEAALMPPMVQRLQLMQKAKYESRRNPGGEWYAD